MKRHGSLNHIYRLVWSHVSSSWVPVAETTRGRGKGSCRTLIAAALSLTAGIAEAGPLGGQVVSGKGTIAQSGVTTTITQSSSTLSLNWQSFNIAPQETVTFAQPSVNALAVNRIFDPNGSVILGHLTANGQVYLINPNGVLFGRGAQVNVGGLVASTLDLDATSLTGDVKNFRGNAAGSIVNEGTIAAAPGGYVALLGHQVSNRGVIRAQLGSVALGAGSAATLTFFKGTGLLHLQVDLSLLHSVAENGGLIRADGGQVLMTAGAKDTLLASVVNNTGVIDARTVEDHEGTITLLGGAAAGTVNVAGRLDASAPNTGHGGFIETAAAHVEVANGARVTTAAHSGLYGSWLIDSQDFTVAATGGDITGPQLGTNLATTAVAVESRAGKSVGGGNVNVNDPVSWSANTTLTLTASNDVNVNANITATGNVAGLRINPNAVIGADAAGGQGVFNLRGASITLSGTTPSLSIANVTFTVINSLGAATSVIANDLQGMNADLTGHYALGSNIDASPTVSWNGGAGFTPIGTSLMPFNGTFDGLGHTINGVAIDQILTSQIGLFGFTNSASVIRNVGLVGGSVTGAADVGELVGTNHGAISNSYATGAVSSYRHAIGGLVGWNDGAISNSYATGTVSGDALVGGLAGINAGAISNSYAVGIVKGNSSLGGLVGANFNATISNSYATGTVTGPVTGEYIQNADVGGLVGINYGGAISNSYATGAVTGNSYVGGLVGKNINARAIGNARGTSTVNDTTTVGGFIGVQFASISDSHATGAVSGFSISVGGLVGDNHAQIANSYASGNVTSTATSVVLANSEVGGLVGLNYGSISDSHATGAVSSWSTRFMGGLVGLNDGGAISNSYATGMVTANVGGQSYSGGLVGGNWVLRDNGGLISNSYASGAVFGPESDAGGLVGNNRGAIRDSHATSTVNGRSAGGLVGINDGAISNSYATGAVTGVFVGGLVGLNIGSISDTYATGAVGAAFVGSDVGGLVGYARDASATSNSYWNIDTTGQKTSPGGGIGLTTLQMQTASNFAGFTFTTTPGASSNNWVMVDTDGSLNNVAGAAGATLPMLASEYSTTITNAHQLQLMTMALGAQYTLAANVDASATARAATNGTGDIWSTSGGFVPIGSSGSGFSGTFDGRGHTINGLSINRTTANVGLFGYTESTAVIRNVGSVGGSVQGNSNVGSLVGTNTGAISDSYATGAVTGTSFVGGLVGGNGGPISNSYATGTVTGDYYVGGLVGANVGPITDSYATGAVTGDYYVGGLVGANVGPITDSYATGVVKRRRGH